jgi:uncharacterized protein YjbI with pentapeptide repeats
MADLRSADLRSANLDSLNNVYRNGRVVGSNPTNLNKADLRKADLSGAYLYGILYDGANFRSANLTGAFVKGEDWLSHVLKLLPQRSSSAVIVAKHWTTEKSFIRDMPMHVLQHWRDAELQFETDINLKTLQDVELDLFVLRPTNLWRGARPPVSFGASQ